jgi:hypothetical protein
MAINLKALQEQRQACLDEARKLVETAETENRDLTSEQEKRYTELLDKAKALEKRSARAGEMERAAAPPAAEDRGQPAPGAAAAAAPGAQPEGRFSAPAVHPGEHREYRLLRAINQMATAGRLSGFEAEVSSELEKRHGRKPQGFYMPHNFMDPLGEGRSLTSLERRDNILVGDGAGLTTTTGSGLKPTLWDVSQFIEILRNRIICQKLGARVLNDLTGDLAIPQQTGAATAYWFDNESGLPSASNQVVPMLTLKPHTVGAYTDISRKFLQQSCMDAEAFVRMDLGKVMALAIDYAAINGTGLNGQPQGILQNPNVAQIALGASGGPLTWAAVVGLETAIAAANADVGLLAYCTNAMVAGAAKETPKIGSTFPIFIMDGDHRMNGYPTGISNQVPSNISKGSATNLSSLIFGNWDDLVLAFWSGLDILIDPYTGGISGTIRVVMLQDCEIAIRHNASFAVIPDIQASNSEVAAQPGGSTG